MIQIQIKKPINFFILIKITISAGRILSKRTFEKIYDTFNEIIKINNQSL